MKTERFYHQRGILKKWRNQTGHTPMHTCINDQYQSLQKPKYFESKPFIRKFCLSVFAIFQRSKRVQIVTTRTCLMLAKCSATKTLSPCKAKLIAMLPGNQCVTICSHGHHDVTRGRGGAYQIHLQLNITWLDDRMGD